MRAEKRIPEGEIRYIDYSQDESTIYSNETKESDEKSRKKSHEKKADKNEHLIKSKIEKTDKKDDNEHTSRDTITAAKVEIDACKKQKTIHQDAEENKKNEELTNGRLTKECPEENSNNIEITLNHEESSKEDEPNNTTEDAKDEDSIDKLIEEEEKVMEEEVPVVTNELKDDVVKEVDEEIENMIQDERMKTSSLEPAKDDDVSEDAEEVENETSITGENDEEKSKEKEVTEDNKNDIVVCTDEELAVIEEPDKNKPNEDHSDKPMKEPHNKNEPKDIPNKVSENEPKSEIEVNDENESSRPSSSIKKLSTKPIDEAILNELAEDILNKHEKEEQLKAEDRQKVDELIQDLSLNDN